MVATEECPSRSRTAIRSRSTWYAAVAYQNSPSAVVPSALAVSARSAAARRAPLQKKIGSGLAPAEFRRRFKQGKAGHVGLKESLALIAHCLGWTAKNIVETGDAVVADHHIRTQFLEVKKGQTCGLHQYAQATVNGKVRLTLDIKMYLDAKNPHDAVQIEGVPPLDVVINGGVAGDQATVAALVNTAPGLLQRSCTVTV